ncbi:MAG TPA: endonuclease/exonuclease/phosphatase family protein [Burkholderiales bacterium]|nr:endonuclease/exonuclease/phosphatase family protein [Burkholderiales bacterium]
MPKPAASLADSLRIASYNVHGCVGADGRKDAARIAAVIAETQCDTAGLQEVDYRLDYIAMRLGMQAVPGLTLLRHDGPFGNALVTRRRVLDVRRLAFGYGRREPRNALDVDLEVGGRPLRVIVTHLGLFAAERRYQMRKLLEIIRRNPAHQPIVVLGDMNEWLPLSRPLRWLNGILGASLAERSFPARWPLFALDRVWVRPRHALLALKAHRSPLAAAASDHLPVKALIAPESAQASRTAVNAHHPEDDKAAPRRAIGALRRMR